MESTSEKWQNRPSQLTGHKKNYLLTDKEVSGDSNVIEKETERF